MKKFFKALAAIFAVAILAFAIVGCNDQSNAGNSGTQAAIIETYKTESMTLTIEGTSMDFVAGQTVNGVTVTENTLVIELKDNGTCNLSMDFMGMVQKDNGTWRKDGNQLILTDSDGVSQTATLDGTKLTLDMAELGMSMRFVLNKK